MPVSDGIGQDIGEATVLKETNAALLVKLIDHDDIQVWIPKSQLHADSEVYEAGTAGILIVTPWIAKKLELI